MLLALYIIIIHLFISICFNKSTKKKKWLCLQNGVEEQFRALLASTIPQDNDVSEQKLFKFDNLHWETLCVAHYFRYNKKIPTIAKIYRAVKVDNGLPDISQTNL